MKILILPDSYKGSLTSTQVCDAMERGIKTAIPSAETVKLPLSDGGEGFAACVKAMTGGREISVEVTYPMGEPGPASYLITPDGQTAVIEMAAACGLTLIPEEERNPINVSTYGLGQLIAHALSQKVKRLIIGLGGSATNDGGAGMLAALGARFTDANGREISPTPQGLAHLAHADFGKMPDLSQIEMIAACDVTNPLCGATGASYIFGPQKGASPEDVARLDGILARYARITGMNPDLPGAGAAGGTGAALLNILGARFQSGIDLMLELCVFKKLAQDADAVFTGEGRTDSQSADGKAVSGVAKAAKEMGLPVICISGAIDNQSVAPLYEQGVTAMFSIADGPMDLNDAMKNAARLLEDQSRHVAAVLNTRL